MLIVAMSTSLDGNTNETGEPEARRVGRHPLGDPLHRGRDRVEVRLTDRAEASPRRDRLRSSAGHLPDAARPSNDSRVIHPQCGQVLWTGR